jgi:hypothetical protein
MEDNICLCCRIEANTWLCDRGEDILALLKIGGYHWA